MLHHPFFGNGQKRQRELHLGSGCAGYDARFRGDQHVIVSALQIYINWNTGDQDIIKSIITLVGACLFIIGASIVFPAFFGYRI